MPTAVPIFTPTFDGNPIFGSSWIVSPIPIPNDRVMFAVPGVNGVFSKNLGSRGGRTVLRALWVGVDPSEVAAAEQILLNYMRSGLVSVFTDVNGAAWPQVCIESYSPDGDEVQPTSGGWGKSFTVTLFHHV